MMEEAVVALLMVLVVELVMVDGEPEDPGALAPPGATATADADSRILNQSVAVNASHWFRGQGNETLCAKIDNCRETC